MHIAYEISHQGGMGVAHQEQIEVVWTTTNQMQSSGKINMQSRRKE
jgi:hypothetical protein